MRYLRAFVRVTGALCIAGGAFHNEVNAADVAIVEQIVCKVNSDIITSSDLQRDRKEMETELRQRGMAGRQLQEALNTESANLLGGRIDTLLLIQKGKELDLKVDNEVTRQIANIQRQSGIADPQQFQDFVHEKTGMTFEDYKKDLKDQVLKNRVIRQEISGSIKVKREELEAYYNDHKDEFQRKEQIYLRGILISIEGKDAAGIAAADRKARDVSRRGKAGEKFAELAQTNSDSPTSVSGGEMPAFEKEELRKDIADAVWEKDRGFVTDPIRTPQGFEIYKVEEHQKAGLADFEAVMGQVEDKVISPRMGGAYREYLTKLRKDAFLEIKEGFQDSFAAAGKNTAWSDPAQLTPQTVTKQQVAAQTHHKKLLWAIPIPGTKSNSSGSSSSR